MVLAEQPRYQIDPNAVILTQGVYETSPVSLALMLNKFSLVRQMGEPSSQFQKTAFEIIADCMQAETLKGPEFRARVLGVNIGRLTRNADYLSENIPIEEQWERKTIGFLVDEVEHVLKSQFAEAFEQARDNVLYGTWERPNFFEYYIWLINNDPWDKIPPILHKWFEKFTIDTESKVIEG